MGYSRVVCSITLLLSVGNALAQNPALDVHQIADTMVRLCIAGGSTQAIMGTAMAGADISLRSLDVTGNLSGQFHINKSSAEGLVSGIDNAMTQVAANQVDKVRDCLKPVRERLLDVLLPVPRIANPAPDGGWKLIASPNQGSCGFNKEILITISKGVISGRDVSGFIDDNGTIIAIYTNIITVAGKLTSSRSGSGTWRDTLWGCNGAWKATRL